ncbi:bifunctional 4-hydroxy-2-oxoglutarate aldolase/2-dehydro-3-deoxy-phosphogluconate aldolase [uncultured Abyssibacter sp.]|uniref:bifunctional 4-hydroxy-2-oxoglutarate aldolase/2-dehydro-3-deoxy-phosphogluconate aldolase n=1 Tax=uncultured Abyssibacter sp. TaxID=2320202 RepID=UPI0032B12499|tara:strand:+ start:72 stop:779 length:708 start_codon:yes stop_codon:yes gene_type:complete
MTLKELLYSSPVIPVLVIDSLDDAVPLARALVRGGLPNLEITLRTDVALEAVRKIAREVPDAQVGVGTVRTVDDIRRAWDVGATFAVSPGLTPALLDLEHSIPLLPGAMTPTEIMTAFDAGFRCLKLFPASFAGGADFLRAIAGPLPDVTFCPTGGIREDDLLRYLSMPNVACVGGTWITPKDAVARKDWDMIETLARRAVAIANEQPTAAGRSGSAAPEAGEEDPGAALESLRS